MGGTPVFVGTPESIETSCTRASTVLTNMAQLAWRCICANIPGGMSWISVFLAPVLIAAVACGQAPSGSASPTDPGPIVRQPLHTLAGVVRERYAPDLFPVSDATVTVTSGLQAGRTVTTDLAGRYVFEGMTAEPVTLVVSVAGFERATAEAAPPRAPDIPLTPETLSVSWDARDQPYRSAFRIPFSVAHWGPARLTISFDTWYCVT